MFEAGLWGVGGANGGRAIGEQGRTLMSITHRTQVTLPVTKSGNHSSQQHEMVFVIAEYLKASADIH